VSNTPHAHDPTLHWTRSRFVSAKSAGRAETTTSTLLVLSLEDRPTLTCHSLRLHEVVSRATTLSNGIRVAGLGQVNQPGVQDVDVSSVLRGHMELQTKMGEVLRVIDVDA
jgi:hypothetical protein